MILRPEPVADALDAMGRAIETAAPELADALAWPGRTGVPDAVAVTTGASVGAPAQPPVCTVGVPQAISWVLKAL